MGPFQTALPGFPEVGIHNLARISRQLLVIQCYFPFFHILPPVFLYPIQILFTTPIICRWQRAPTGEKNIDEIPALQLTENIQRADIDPIDTARAVVVGSPMSVWRRS
jgi:hypothetical protein